MIVITYGIDKASYDNPNTHHNIMLVTTEYSLGRKTLVHLQSGELLHNRLHQELSHVFRKRIRFQDEQFIFKTDAKTECLTHGEFKAKLKQFDMGQTLKTQETLENYCYIDKANQQDIVGITITIQNDNMYAVIDFKDPDQYENFIAPAWLVPLFDCTAVEISQAIQA